MSNKNISRALISVSDKSGLVELARALDRSGVEILSTGGTAKTLKEAGIAVQDVSDYTGFPEMMDGRVKTLHPKIHGGILGRSGTDDEVMAEHDIKAIDLVVINLYPFEDTIARSDCSFDVAIENIDIGGPTMLRAAAKNYKDVTVVVDPSDYDALIEELETTEGVSTKSRYFYSVKTFEHTAKYDGAIANYLGSINELGESKPFANTYNRQFRLSQTMRYGENPHQNAAFYVEQPTQTACVASAVQLQGKELSYNNIADTDAALECVKQFIEGSACVIVKHANPCGVAVADSQLEAYNKAFSTDSESAFGGIIAFNEALDANTAKAIVDQQFVEVIIAPAVNDNAKSVLAAKQNVRVLESGAWPTETPNRMDSKRVNGGLLVQEVDNKLVNDLQIVTKRQPTDEEMIDLLFSWKVAKFVKSNAIIYAKDSMTIGIGAGQMSRVNSARIAAIKAEQANLPIDGAVMASDAFFPFRDGLDNAAKVGVKALIQPGGSMRDDEVIAAADEHNIAMVFTGMRHFKH